MKLFRKNFEYSKSQDAKNFQYWNCRFVFFYDKDSTHTFNNKGQNCIERKLDDLPLKNMYDYHLLNDIATSIA